MQNFSIKPSQLSRYRDPCRGVGSRQAGSHPHLRLTRGPPTLRDLGPRNLSSSAAPASGPHPAHPPLSPAPTPRRNPKSPHPTTTRPLPTNLTPNASQSEPAALNLPNHHHVSLDISQLPKRLRPGQSVVLWYRNDLRVDDHPGLVSAVAALTAAAAKGGSSSSAAAAPLLPVYLLDPSHLAHMVFTPGGPEALSAALQRLRTDLRARGSDLAVRIGPWATELRTLVTGPSAVGAVVSEDEVETRWRHPADGALAAAVADGEGVVLSYYWRSTIWPADRFDVRYREWSRQRGSAAPPLDAPVGPLPGFPSGVESGDIPSGAEMRALLSQAALAAYDNSGGHGSSLAEMATALAAGGETAAAAERAVRVSAGPYSPLELLRRYLGLPPSPSPSHPSPSSPSHPPLDLDAEVAALRVPGVEGAPFTGLFGAAKALGTLSARRVLWEAYAADGRPYGSTEPRRLRPPPAAAAAVAAEAAEFHRALAVLDEDRMVAPGVEVHFWRWQGGLTDYCEATPTNPLPDAPAVLLVHGFGAFGDQWRDNMAALAAAGYRVFAPTFPGFGRSQKAAVPYSQDLWRDFLRDFILQVVRSPVAVAGNSIGGFISTSLAADYPGLVRGLVLVNSAGPIDPSFEIGAWRAAVAAGRPAPPGVVVSAVSSALFWYLERTVPSTLRWLYPTQPDRADEWLAREILRAAGDSGAIDVFKSVWYLPPPRALNWMVAEAWRGPTLVLQGALDPLNDARGRALQMGQLCPNVEVQLLQAGHCPHDEVPQQFNTALLDFIQRAVLPAAATASSGTTAQGGKQGGPVATAPAAAAAAGAAEK